jgi:hypothetical protein
MIVIISFKEFHSHTEGIFIISHHIASLSNHNPPLTLGMDWWNNKLSFFFPNLNLFQYPISKHGIKSIPPFHIPFPTTNSQNPNAISGNHLAKTITGGGNVNPAISK